MVAGLMVLAGVGGVAAPAAAAAPAARVAAVAGAPSGQCSDANLRVRVHDDPEGAGAGQRLSYIDFENHGPRSCALRGARASAW